MALSQSLAALERANHNRLAAYTERARIRALAGDESKRELARLLVDADDPGVLCGKVADYLMCAERIGVSNATRLMGKADIRRADARLRDLTERQRAVLADSLLERVAA